MSGNHSHPPIKENKLVFSIALNLGIAAPTLYFAGNNYRLK